MTKTMDNMVIGILIYLFVLNTFLLIANIDYRMTGAENKDFEDINSTSKYINDTLSAEMEDTDDMNIWKLGGKSFKIWDILFDMFTFGGFTNIDVPILRMLMTFFLQVLPLLILFGAMADFVRGK